MYLLLAAALITGMVNTLTNVFDTYNYRETVSPWFRSLFSLHPAPELMADAPWTFQLHALVVLALLGYLAVHAARAYVQRADRLPGAAICGVPQPRSAEVAEPPLCEGVGRARGATRTQPLAVRLPADMQKSPFHAYRRLTAEL